MGEKFGNFFYYLTTQKLFSWVPKKAEKIIFYCSSPEGGVKGGLTNVKLFFFLKASLIGKVSLIFFSGLICFASDIFAAEFSNPPITRPVFQDTFSTARETLTAGRRLLWTMTASLTA